MSFPGFKDSADQPDCTWTTTDISLDDLEKLEVLWSGNGGRTVHKVRHKATAETYALKTVNDNPDPAWSRQIRREIEILRITDCPNVVHCHGVFKTSSGGFAILMEYMDRDSLNSLRGKLSESQLAGIASQILQGLCYLRSKKIFHRDIKPTNLLINSDNIVKITDFGVSKIMDPSLDTSNTYVGTCYYMSPERFDPHKFLEGNSKDYDVYAGDIWSFGLTMLELYMGDFPLLKSGQEPDWSSMMCNICLSDPPRAPEEASQAFKSFIECCLEKDWSKRWTASQLLDHPFVQQYQISSDS